MILKSPTTTSVVPPSNPGQEAKLENITAIDYTARVRRGSTTVELATQDEEKLGALVHLIKEYLEDAEE